MTALPVYRTTALPVPVCRTATRRSSLSEMSGLLKDQAQASGGFRCADVAFSKSIMALSGTSTWKATSRLRVLICGGGIGLDAPSGEAAANGAGGSVPGPGLAMEPLDADAMTSAERAFEPGAGASGSVLAWTASARPRPWRSVLRHRPVSTEQRSGGTVPHPGAAGCASGCSDRAADRQVDLGRTPQPGIVHDARQQAGQHQPQGRLRIDAGLARTVGGVAVPNLRAQPRQIQNPVHPRQHMVVRDKVAQGNQPSSARASHAP